MKKISIYILLPLMALVIGIGGGFIYASKSLDNLAAVFYDFSYKTFSAWYSSMLDAYFNGDTEVAFWTAQQALKYYEEGYPDKLKDMHDWPKKFDITVFYGRAAILAKNVNNMNLYNRYIDSALKISNSSTEKIFNKMKTEKELIDYIKKYDQAIRESKNHNLPLNANG